MYRYSWSVWIVAAGLLLLFASTATTVSAQQSSLRSTSNASCPDRSDPCMDDGNLEQCQRLQSEGCRHIHSAPDSCPYQFSSHESSSSIRDARTQTPAPAPAPAPTRRQPRLFFDSIVPTAVIEDACGRPDDNYCNPKRVFRRCKNLVQRGCKAISRKQSCPPQDLVCINPYLLPLFPRPRLLDLLPDCAFPNLMLGCPNNREPSSPTTYRPVVRAPIDLVPQPPSPGMFATRYPVLPPRPVAPRAPKSMLVSPPPFKLPLPPPQP